MHTKFDVFLSHSSTDKLWVRRLKDSLKECGLRVWLDQDEVRPGDLFVHALEQGLASSHTVALIISPEAMASGWVREEYCRAISLAQAADKPLRLIPVMLREAELPGFLLSRHSVDFRHETSFKANLDRLVWGITGKKMMPSSYDGNDAGINSIYDPALVASEKTHQFLVPDASTLQIVSLTLTERQPFPVLDIKLLNHNEVSAFVHQLELIIVSSKIQFERISTSPPVFSSHTYHILIDPLRPESVSKDLSFVVTPRSADRFHVVVGATAGDIIDANEVLLLQISAEFRKNLEDELRQHCYPGSYTPKAVELTALVRLKFNGTKTIDSQPVELTVYIDPHFKPGSESQILDSRSYIDQIVNSPQPQLPESCEMLGYIELEEKEGKKAEALLLENLKSSNHIPVLVESAAALARRGLDYGIKWLLIRPSEV